MLAILALLGILLILLLLGVRWFAFARTGDIAQALRTFAAVFGLLAGTGLLFMGRLGLAIAAGGATFMAIRGLVRARRGADPLREPQGAGAGSSEVRTDLLEMRLDHGSGRLSGRVRRGRHAGTSLDRLGLGDLLALLEEARRDDPPSVALLETYLDRERPDWRTQGFERQAGAAEGATGAMDEATALRILGLEPGAGAAQIRAAHRRLMGRLHPDHGGSDWLASQINQARDLLLRRAE